MIEKKREWEKGTAQPIPRNKYSRFKELLVEKSKKHAERNLMLFLTGRATGYRMQDLVELTIGEIVDFLAYGQFEIQEQKQYKQWQKLLEKNPKKKKPPKRITEIGNNLDRYLREYIKGKKRSEYAFPSNKFGGYEPITQKSFSDILSEVGKAMKLDNISGHSLRKTYATTIYEDSNYNLEKVRVALGHKSIEETKKYLGIKEAMIKDANRLADDGI